jgi:RarD protein
VSPVEVVANRVVWSLVFLIIVIVTTRSWVKVLQAARSRRNVGLLALAAAFLSLNWGVYVWAVISDQIVEASLGYFINPLVSVALGVLVLRERLRIAQWVAVGIALLAVGVLTFSYGRPPWISITLAVSFGVYGLIKKQVGIGSVESLTIETAVLAPVALVVMAVIAAQGSAGLASGDPVITILCRLSGSCSTSRPSCSSSSAWPSTTRRCHRAAGSGSSWSGSPSRSSASTDYGTPERASMTLRSRSRTDAGVTPNRGPALRRPGRTSPRGAPARSGRRGALRCSPRVRRARTEPARSRPS